MCPGRENRPCPNTREKSWRLRAAAEEPLSRASPPSELMWTQTKLLEQLDPSATRPMMSQ